MLSVIINNINNRLSIFAILCPPKQLPDASYLPAWLWTYFRATVKIQNFLG